MQVAGTGLVWQNQVHLSTEMRLKLGVKRGTLTGETIRSHVFGVVCFTQTVVDLAVPPVSDLLTCL